MTLTTASAGSTTKATIVIEVAPVDHFTAIHLAIAKMGETMAARVFVTTYSGLTLADQDSRARVEASQDSLNMAVKAWLETVKVTELDTVTYMLLNMLRADQKKFETYFYYLYRTRDSRDSRLYRMLSNLGDTSYNHLLELLLARYHAESANVDSVSDDVVYMLRLLLTWWLEDREKAIDADPRQIDGENQHKLGGLLHLVAYTMPEVTARDALFTSQLCEEMAGEMAGLISAREQELSQAGLAWRRLHNDEDVALSVLKRPFGFDGNPDIAFKKHSDAVAATTAAWGKLEKAIQSW